MTFRLLLDEDIHKRAAEHLRLREHDAIHVREIERDGFTDEEQLVSAHTERRILVTFNVKDFTALHKHFFNEGKNHSGIIVSKQLPIGEFIKKLAVLLHEYRQEDFRDSIHFL